MLLHVACVLTHSKCKLCNCQDINLDVQQHNIYKINIQIGILLPLKCHYMPANSYCLVLH